MYRTIMTAAFAAILALGFGVSAQASRVVTNTTDQLFNAVAEVSTTMLVKVAGTPVRVFVNGTYSITNVVVLERERGSPGSGAWQTVAIVTATPAAANASVETMYLTRRNHENLRLRMTATDTGAVIAYLTDAPAAPAEYTNTRVYKTFHDDFDVTETTTIDAQRYVSIDADGGSSGTICAVTLTLEEGALICISGTGEDGADALGFSLIDVTDDGALVSDGTMVFEVRLKASDYDGQVGMCLYDEEVVASFLMPFDIDTNAVVFDNSNNADAACIMAQDEADSPDVWQAASAINDAVGNNADEANLGPAVADDTYVILRLEIDAEGNAYFYVDGVLFFAEPLAVATTARLIPMLWANTTTDGAGGAITYNVDYITFIAQRPSS